MKTKKLELLSRCELGTVTTMAVASVVSVDGSLIGFVNGELDNPAYEPIVLVAPRTWKSNGLYQYVYWNSEFWSFGMVEGFQFEQYHKGYFYAPYIPLL